MMAPFHDEYMDAIKQLKSQLTALNKRFASGQSWIMGDKCTVADIYLAGLLTVPFQVCLDMGFQKGMPAITTWFLRVARLPSFVQAFGYVKIC